MPDGCAINFNLMLKIPSSPIYILGISCFYHDSAACLLKDGVLVAACHEERFTRKKHDDSFPRNAIAYCLAQEHITSQDLAAVAFYEKPLLKFERILETTINSWPSSYRMFITAIPQWLREKLWIKNRIKKELSYRGPIYFPEHHLSHAASSFLVSPFEKAAILTLDGVGEWETATYGIGEGTNIKITHNINFPHSIGLFYSIFTHFLGFRPNSAEYKVMGLAPYGTPRFLNEMRRLIDIKQDGSFALNLDYFTHDRNLAFYNERVFARIFGFPRRDPDAPIEQHHKDLAMSLQRITEEVVLNAARHIHEETGLTDLCLAGGVALNCVANGRIIKETPIKRIFVQPAAGDAGGALGAALIVWIKSFNKKRAFTWEHCFWGPTYDDERIKYLLEREHIPHRHLTRAELLEEVARLIEQNAVIGWFQGHAEWGPRALGNRSIIADARRAENKDRVNLKIKFRESFRPFAPSVLEERASEYFDIDSPSPYMLITAQVKPDKRHIPAVTHCDGSARMQTVNRKSNPLYYDLLKTFEQRTGCPVIINTSFNVRGEPIVLTPEDAWHCFLNTKMDYLVMGSFILDKKDMKNFYAD